MNGFNLKLIGANDDGSRIFAVMTYLGKRLVKGFYDFDKERFIVLEYYKKNFPIGIGKSKARNILKELLMIQHDWEM